MSIGIGGSVLVLAMTGAAWWLTGNAALFSDAVENMPHPAASALALYAARLAKTPAESNHPYGHAKAEFFAAVVEGVLMLSPRW